MASKYLMILNTAIIHSKISYEENIDSFVVSMSEEPNNVPNEIQKNVRHIFFHKRKEWNTNKN